MNALAIQQCCQGVTHFVRGFQFVIVISDGAEVHALGFFELVVELEADFSGTVSFLAKSTVLVFEVYSDLELACDDSLAVVDGTL